MRYNIHEIGVGVGVGVGDNALANKRSLSKLGASSHPTTTDNAFDHSNVAVRA